MWDYFIWILVLSFGPFFSFSEETFHEYRLWYCPLTCRWLLRFGARFLDLLLGLSYIFSNILDRPEFSAFSTNFLFDPFAPLLSWNKMLMWETLVQFFTNISLCILLAKSPQQYSSLHPFLTEMGDLECELDFSLFHAEGLSAILKSKAGGEKFGAILSEYLSKGFQKILANGNYLVLNRVLN